MKRFYAVILTLSMLLSLAACDKSDEPNGSDPGQSGSQTYTQRRYIQEKISPPDGYDGFLDISASDFGMFVTACTIDKDGNMDGSELVLDAQNQVVAEMEQPLEPEGYWSYPSSTRILDDGRLVLFTTVVPILTDDSGDWDNSYHVADIYDWKTETWQRFELDTALNTNQTYGIALYAGQYICFSSSQAVAIYQTDGQLAGLYKSQNRVAGSCFMSDGSVAVLEYKQGLEATEEDLGQIIRFDPESGSAEEFMLPSVQIMQLLDAPSDEEYFSFYIDDGSGLKGIDPNKQPQQIFDWVGVGLRGSAMDLEALSGRRFLYRDVNGAVILKPTDVDMSQISVLRMGTLNPTPISGLVAEFNQTSEKYQIQLVDYSKMSSADGSITGAQQLDMDIVTGSGPDIFDLASLPMKKYQQAGLLEDLMPYIQADESLEKVSLLQGPIEALMTEGKLYTLVPAYGIRSFIGDPEYTGIERLDIPALTRLFGEMEEGANPFGESVSKLSFLNTLLNLNHSQFADWDSLECDFNVPDFHALLEMSGQLPEQEDVSDQITRLYTGAQMLSLRNIFCIEDLVVLNSYLHENMELYGLPTVPNQGTAMMPLVALGISVNCQDKQGAWAFLSSLLSDDYQKSLAGQALPITQAGFDYIAQEHIDWVTAGGGITTAGPLDEALYMQVTDDRFLNMLQDAIDAIGAVYNNDSQMIDLIMRDAQACFAGDLSGQKAAEHIQSRAAMYMAEQYG